MTNFVNALIQALVPVAVEIIVGVAGIIGSLAIVQLSKSAKFKHVADAIEMLQNAVVDTVYANQQVLVDDLKAAAADGKLSESEIAMLQARTIERAKAKVGPAAANVITAAGIDLDQLILDSAESVVRSIKEDA